MLFRSVHLLAVVASDVLLVTVVLIHDGGLVSTTAITEVERARLCLCVAKVRSYRLQREWRKTTECLS